MLGRTGPAVPLDLLLRPDETIALLLFKITEPALRAQACPPLLPAGQRSVRSISESFGRQYGGNEAAPAGSRRRAMAWHPRSACAFKLGGDGACLREAACRSVWISASPGKGAWIALVDLIADLEVRLPGLRGWQARRSPDIGCCSVHSIPGRFSVTSDVLLRCCTCPENWQEPGKCWRRKPHKLSNFLS